MWNAITAKIKQPFGTAILAALVGGLLPTIASVFCVYLVYYGTPAQDRQTRLEIIARFDQSSNQVVGAGEKFLLALNAGKDLGEARTDIASFSARQNIELEGLKHLFPSEPALITYQDALRDFSLIARQTESPLDIKLWAEGFGKVIDSKLELTGKLYRRLGINA